MSAFGVSLNLLYLANSHFNLAACAYQAVIELKNETAQPENGGRRATIEYLTALPPQECIWRFRFFASEIADLATALRIPNPFITCNRNRFSAVEALALLLARFRSEDRQDLIAAQYGRAPSAIAEVVTELMEYLDEEWKHLLETRDENPLLKPQRLAEYAKAIHAAGASMSTIWGFLECTTRFIYRPSHWERQTHNEHDERRSLKLQVVKLPNGHIGTLFGSIKGSLNAKRLLKESNLMDWCEAHAFQPGANAQTPLLQRHFQVYGDPAYGLSPVLMSPFAGRGRRSEEEKEWNAAMASVQAEAEHSFADVFHSWHFLNSWWKHRVFSSSPVQRYYRVGVLLSNALNCMRPNTTAMAFDCLPPTLEEYFV